MDKCGICLTPAEQLFETGKDGVYACFKCQPLVPEVSIGESSSDQQNTLEVVDDENGDTSLFCGLCQKSFQKNAQLQNHLRHHRAERRFVCTFCNKAFSQSNNLRAHLRIHTNERPFKCSECGKAFTQLTNLNNHVRLHTGERPFVCPEPGCDKAYAQVTNLNQHRKRHLSGRPVESSYDCTICGESFQQRNQMYIHRREAHGEPKCQVRSQRRACTLCDLTFPNERLLIQHAAQHLGSHAHAQLDHDDDDDEDSKCSSYPCVFSSCAARLSSPREHTEHLLAAHQLRVLANTHAEPPRRGRPPKIIKEEDPLDIKDSAQFHEVTIIKHSQQRQLPKLKVQSLFQ